MSELKAKIHQVIQEPTLAVLSTLSEKGLPWARYVMVQADEDLLIRFSTFRQSRKVAQIAKNAEVHIVCGVASLPTAQHYLQIQGKAEVSDDPAIKKAYWHEGLKVYFKGPDDPNYVVVSVRPYRIEYQTMKDMQPEVWQA